MNDILEILLKDKSVKFLKQLLADKSFEKIQINGLYDSLRAAFFASLNKSLLMISNKPRTIDFWLDDFKFLLPNFKIKILPELDFFNVAAEVKSLEFYSERFKILNDLILNKPVIILSTVSAAVNPVVSPNIFLSSKIQFKVGDQIIFDDLISKFIDLGYQRSNEVDSIGQFAIRGGIIDIFPINQNFPIRIEFFDDIIESLRVFDLNSKRSMQKIKSFSLLPVNLVDENSSSIVDYISDGVVIFDEPQLISEEIQRLVDENPSADILPFDSLLFNPSLFVSLNFDKNFVVDEIINVNSTSILQNNLIKKWIGSRHSSRKNFSNSIQKEKKSESQITNSELFNDISVGDYVVHMTHGIGKFLGVKSMQVGNSTQDFVQIQYNGDDKIFLPTDQLDSLHKYISIGDTAPKLSRLNTADWTRAKSKAKAAAEDIADKLIDIYARRNFSEGFAFAPDDALQIEFEDACEFELTQDQARTLAEVKADMEKQKPMDRLICGDVGFGKTEIAIRAAFKAAMNGKQVAFLVPTTFLAYQHFLTFQKRFKNFLPTVDLLSRFRSTKEQSDILKRLTAGHLDILIGTHSILNSNKVVFKDLGLLIVDEEQRFGVKQKDKFRDLSSGVDVLSLSATPIPRSLHMSMIGARDLSVIETAPADRIPVQTYVVEAKDDIITAAIRRELNRHGQIFFVYNRIENIDLMREHIQMLVPDAKIMTAHGQMHSELLEQIFLDFYNGAFDILLSTSIIENGLDISNANTIIVYNADYFGLSQLYQLRGRVGRSSRLAFAYFLFQRDKNLSEAADKRLRAIKDFAQLGSSFNIALRDLQIRGAGNLLGSQQHGHISGVGFALYSQLLKDAVSKIKNKSAAPIKKIDDFKVNISLNVDAFFSDDFIPNPQSKFLFYQRLASLDNVDDIDDLQEELIDRFGNLPNPAQNLFDLAVIKIYAKKIHIASISQNSNQIFFQFAADAKLKSDALQLLNKRFNKNINLILRINTLKLILSDKKNFLPEIISVLEILK